MARHVTAQTSQAEVVASDVPVIVDFWAEWCPPCRQVAPVLDTIVEERGDEVKLVKVNIDEEPGLATKYGIVSIPTMILFEAGEPRGRRRRRSSQGQARGVSRHLGGPAVSVRGPGQPLPISSTTLASGSRRYVEQ